MLRKFLNILLVVVVGQTITVFSLLVAASQLAAGALNNPLLLGILLVGITIQLIIIFAIIKDTIIVKIMCTVMGFILAILVSFFIVPVIKLFVH